MSSGTDSRIPLQLSQNCVVASIQVDLDDAVLVAFREELLDLLRNSGARGVILDLSGVAVMDLNDFRAIRNTMDMARLMGAATVLSGLQPGVVSALVDLDADTANVKATLTLDDAFEWLALIRREHQQVDEPEEMDEPLGEQPGDGHGQFGERLEGMPDWADEAIRRHEP